MARTRMNTVDDFLKETATQSEHYSNGLINKGEFVRQCMESLHKLMDYDLGEAKRVVEGYGLGGQEFSTWMHEQAGKE